MAFPKSQHRWTKWKCWRRSWWNFWLHRRDAFSTNWHLYPQTSSPELLRESQGTRYVVRSWPVDTHPTRVGVVKLQIILLEILPKYPHVHFLIYSLLWDVTYSLIAMKIKMPLPLNSSRLPDPIPEENKMFQSLVTKHWVACLLSFPSSVREGKSVVQYPLISMSSLHHPSPLNQSLWNIWVFLLSTCSI